MRIDKNAIRRLYNKLEEASGTYPEMVEVVSSKCDFNCTKERAKYFPRSKECFGMMLNSHFTVPFDAFIDNDTFLYLKVWYGLGKPVTMYAVYNPEMESFSVYSSRKDREEHVVAQANVRERVRSLRRAEPAPIEAPNVRDTWGEPTPYIQATTTTERTVTVEEAIAQINRNNERPMVGRSPRRHVPMNFMVVDGVRYAVRDNADGSRVTVEEVYRMQRLMQVGRYPRPSRPQWTQSPFTQANYHGIENFIIASWGNVSWAGPAETERSEESP
jgi:hypothetical protein